MKKLVGILVSVSMVFSAGVPAFATEETEPAATLAEEMEPAAVSEEEPEATGGEDTIHYIDGLSLELSYDDRYDLSDLDESISPDEEYVIFQTVYEEGQGITSYKVSQGTKTDVADEALLTLNKTAESDEIDAEGNTEAIATGVGSGTVWLVRADQEEELRELLEKDTEPGPEDPDGENPDDENPDGGNPDDGNPDDGNPDDGNPDGETIDVYEIAVTVEPATLTLMFLTGQSNMEGYCDSYTGYTPGASIACEEGTVYSTYAPWDVSKGNDITGIDFGEVCSTSNYRTTAGDFVAGSLQGAVTEEGTFGDPSNMSGGTLEYPLNSLSGAGGGKTGPDSGLAYEWNQRTGDKVWTINTAYGATDIAQWIPGGNCYDRSAAIWEQVLKTYNAELAAGHYTAGNKLAFWQQGETGDATGLTAAEYEDSFGTMYNAMSKALGMDAFGVFMVRAGYATSRGADYRSEKDLQMSGPRIAQYWLGSGNSPYDNVFVASNANEQWVSDSGVKSYFEDCYGSELSYPTQSGSASVPTTVNEVHYDIHYSQIGHNENGITAADGMVEALAGASEPESISWRDADGKAVTSLTLELATDTGIAVPVADPVYTAKQLTWDSVSGSVIIYDAASGVVQAVDEMAIGTEDLVASAGSKIAILPVTVYTPVDLRDIAGDYTGLYLYKGTWWYLKDGIIQADYEGMAENEYGWWYVKNGRIDYTYTGFAGNEYGWWYFESGIITYETNSVIKDTTGAIGTAGNWYYVVGSKVQTEFPGLAA
ncbi:MAG: sialate O-acetylesterase, partial [Bacteroidales bacterium]|nr:sialate O-acetylesterase [Bacteroidales bacterium]